jgi:membrane protease YdiL (CAAX protease family)
MTNSRENALHISADTDRGGPDGLRILYLLGCIASVYAAYWAAQWAVTGAGIPIDLSAGSGIGEVLFLVIVLICAYLFTRLVWRQSVFGFFLGYLRAWRKTLGGFALCAALTFAVALLWFVLVFEVGGARWSSAAWAQIDGHTIMVALRRGLVAIVLASTEEIVFRGIGFKYLIGAGGKVAVLRAAILSSLIFALSHHFQDPQFWLDIGALGLFIGLFLIGILLALVYWTANSLACAIGVHSGLIWIAVLRKTEIVQLAPSGWPVSNAFDPRAQPSVWLLFILLVVMFWGLRHQMHRVFAIESIDPAAPAAKRSRPPQPFARREALFAIGGIAACIAALVAVQAQIDWSHRKNAIAEYRANVAAFADAVGPDGDVDAAAGRVKFRPASDIRVALTEFKRLADGRVEIGGWAGSLKSDGTPLILFVLAGRTTVLKVETEGPDLNAAQTLELTDAGASNIKFVGAFDCQAGEPIRIVVTTNQRTYLTQFRTCP